MSFDLKVNKILQHPACLDIFTSLDNSGYCKLNDNSERKNEKRSPGELIMFS